MEMCDNISTIRKSLSHKWRVSFIMEVELFVKEVKGLEYVCLDCGGFFEGDEIRRSQNRCESCEGLKSTEEQGESHAQRGL
ncbi:hypothetical protein EL26_12490 [Tumebacillus flagellatus]|uniref:Uncharacterized protein n=1 Tax=Tumebacillus flagellatus TaxID=1157490 RepID=A0A074LP75_9BACL|nr:hypothetical protein EL26_12490 [Tumebacillus flagellatus]